MHGISSLYDHDAESQRYQNKRIPFENSKLKSCVRLNQVDPARIHGVLFVFVISFIVFIVFNFNGNARIHATDLIHWIAFSICKAISNICKTHKFSSVPVDAREPFNLIFELKPQKKKSMRPLWHIANVRIPRTALQKKKKPITKLKRRYIFFLLHIWLTLQLFAKFSRFLCIHLWLGLGVVVVVVVVMLLLRFFFAYR